MRKVFISFILSIVLIFVLSACSNDNKNNDNNKETNVSPEKYASLTEANQQFGFALLEHVDADDDGNLFVSPTSALFALLIVYNGADGETKSEIEQALHLQGLSIEEVNEASRVMLQDLQKNDKEIELAIANSIWLNDQYQLRDDFYKHVTKAYDAKVEEIDIIDSKSADIINDWVKQKTNDTIDEVVESPLPEDLLTYVINALYFKGQWKYAFSKDATEEKTFYGKEIEKETPFMFLNRELKYFETDDLQAVKLPYGEDETMSMDIYLPNESLAIEAFLETIDLEQWNNWQEQFAIKEGTLWLPKFTLEYEEILNKPLQQMGIKKAFSEDEADLSKIIYADEQLYISEVKQKTYIDVYEEGTEASAVTSVEIRLTSAPTEEEAPFYMEVNRPFFFTIQDERTNQILFLGVISLPETKQ